eukprot:TRINITY_DN4827_c0_g1_i1.p1 TRINITY_DN4827_c0_g1~~TRINITY_DN4827_c0_g1_i1.p1  ORF type:complete len:541 (-),score=27.94 TRINITY_DN4827_c0_g1_i1:146-1768(-)
MDKKTSPGETLQHFFKTFIANIDKSWNTSKPEYPMFIIATIAGFIFFFNFHCCFSDTFFQKYFFICNSPANLFRNTLTAHQYPNPAITNYCLAKNFNPTYNNIYNHHTQIKTQYFYSQTLENKLCHGQMTFFSITSWKFGTNESVLIAILVLYLGKVLSDKIRLLKKWNLPDPVVGGVTFAIAALLLYLSSGIQMSFTTNTGDYLMLAFFSTVGLNANLRLLKRGGKGLLIFLAICLAFLIIQDFIGISLSYLLGLDPRVGLLSGSITLTGGHGTGKVYGEMFANAATPLQGAVEMAMACATFGLIIGGIIGAPVSHFLISRFKLSPTAPESRDSTAKKFHSRRYTDEESVCTATMLKAIFMIIICIIAGKPIVDLVSGPNFMLPDFVGSLFAGIIICNFPSIKHDEYLHEETLTIIGNVSLAIFLAMAMMQIKLWELASLAGPLTMIMAAQTLFVIIFTIIITYVIMGRDFDAAVICGGHCGFGLGSTPTAIANMDSIVKKFGPAPRAFLIVPLVGAFSLDILNAMVIQGYLALPCTLR